MATGQSKIELIIELKDKLKTGLSAAKDKIYSDVNSMKAKIAELKHSFSSNFNAMTSEIPGVGNALKLLANPIALVGAGLVGLYKGFDIATKKAADFRTTFRGLQNLNLDKSFDELSSLRESVLDTAYKKGFDAHETANAYNDVQSTTGKYGAEVKRIVEKQGEFAKLMQADFKSYIEGTAKSMINFKFNADRLDEFNRSAYATMNVGVVSFDELAQVQSVYAGAASSAMQDFDAANKMFALFTISTKNANIASSQTKSLFNDLTRKSTIKAFKKAGINVFEANGQFKQADKLLLELNKKFSGMDKDSKIIALKNQFAGSEGLTAMIQAATDKTGQLQTTLTEFDESKFGLNKALELAKNDLNYINEQLENKTNVALIKLGEEMLPLKNWWANFRLEFMEKTNAMVRGEKGNRELSYKTGWTHQNEIFGNLEQDVLGMNKKEFESKQAEIANAMSAYRNAYLEAIKNVEESAKLPAWQEFFISDWRKQVRKDNADFELGYMTEYNKGQYDYLKELSEKFPTMWYDAKFKSPIIQNTNNSTGGSSLGSSANSVTGSAKQIRNITVNIEAFNKGGINTQNTNLQKMDSKQIEEWFVDACMKAVRNVELSYI